MLAKTANLSIPTTQTEISARMRGFLLWVFVWLVCQKVLFFITKTCLYNFDPLKPHFYIVKLGFTGVDIIFLISAQKHRLWVLVRTASPRQFYRVPTIYVLRRNMKNIRNFIWIFQFLEVKFPIYLNRRVFVLLPSSTVKGDNKILDPVLFTLPPSQHLNRL